MQDKKQITISNLEQPHINNGRFASAKGEFLPRARGKYESREALEDAIIERYRTGRYSLSHIARVVGVSQPTVSTILARRNLRKQLRVAPYTLDPDHFTNDGGYQ